MVKVRITAYKIKCKIYYFLLLLIIPYFAVSLNATANERRNGCFAREYQ